MSDDLEAQLEAQNDNGCAGCLTASAKHPCLGHGCTERCILHRAEWAKPLTADTISDEQISELRKAHSEHAFIAGCALTGQNPYTAVGLDDEEWQGARARCAEIINAMNTRKALT